ncbi:hypothetical protein [Pseudochryseolinea flava]|uniref:Uncharacterized protein n=1 Tax=Pseudochryseolinea flava TaxID=2059302 RepID=A0A364XTR3_9BACT|nr:hypothetical protein [Pseudochryseolinea flava]RAV97749.1 hypothetical protein DQQ10_27020 [Pseudochryseolinea flava]
MNHFTGVGQRLLIILMFFLVLHGHAQQTPTPSATANPEAYRKAMETFAKLDQTQHYTESLGYADMNVLPLGMRRTINNNTFTIAVSDIRWHPQHAELTMFARMEIGQENKKKLYFAAQGIKLSYTGDIIGDAMLVLMNDVVIPIQGNTASLILKGGQEKGTGRATQLTYLSVDCKGFKELGVTAELEFSKELMYPVYEKVEKDQPTTVKGVFSTVAADWNDILASITLPPFSIKGLDGFVFTAQEALFDFSDIRNQPGILYPQGYEQNYMIPGNPTLWRGVYVKALSVTLPKPFSDKSKVRPTFVASNMIIDNNGISGVFAAKNVLPLDRGSASGWRFSVDDFNLALEANHLVAAGFSGAIGLPIASKDTLGYDALITADNEYMLRVKPIGMMQFDVFRGEATLLPTSYVQLKVADDKFKPEALLHGSLNFAARIDGSSPEDSTGKKVAEFKGIEFRSLRLKTDAPTFSAEYFGYKGSIKFMNFPISIESIGLRAQKDEVALGMDIKLTLSDGQFSGSTRLELVAKEEKKLGPEGEILEQRWRYKKLAIKDIAIDATIAETFSLKGNLSILSKDPVYGDGFAGSVSMKFDKALKSMKADARAIFGRRTYRYWFVDAKVEFPGMGIQIGPMNLNGFGGGVSYRMKRSPDGADVYLPDSLYGLGVKAAVLFNVGSKQAVNGEASFEVAFSKAGGLNFIGFYGFAKFVGEIPGTDNIAKFVENKQKDIAQKEAEFTQGRQDMVETLQRMKQYEATKSADKVFKPTEKPGEAPFAAALGIQYDFTTEALHATFDLYVNAINGMVRGTASGNRAGWSVIHIDPKEWYVHMGTPTDRLGIKMGIGNILNVETGTYLMIGSRIPGSPPPPQQVADILGVKMDDLDYMRDLNALGEGKGFAFGSSLRVATGDITFLVLYANFQAGLGFDIMLKDYGEAQCEGRSGPIGIDGWYANGQAYAYLQGELGIKVNLWFIKAKVPIIKGAAAALLQAKLPNPVWFKGYMGVQFSVLGGLVKGRARMKITVGDECELVLPGGSPIDMKIISDMTPDDKATDVDVFAVPEVALTMKEGEHFTFEDDSGVRNFRIHLNELYVLNKDGKQVKGKIKWSFDRTNVFFYSDEVLPPNMAMKAVAKVGFEEYRNGKWSIVYTAGQLAQEIQEVSFTTGTAPESIPLHNVTYSYPVVNQQFFLKDESTKGFIQLNRGQSYLFDTDYNHEIQVVQASGEKVSLPMTYSESLKRIDFSMPSSLANGNMYLLDLVAMTTDSSKTEKATTESENVVEQGEDVISVTRNQTVNVIRNDAGKSLLAYQFTLSRYNTFADKIKLQQKRSALVGDVTDVANLQYSLQGGEPFEINELVGSQYTDSRPMVAAQAILDDAYFNEDINPVLYSRLQAAQFGLARIMNGGDKLGLPPVKAIQISTAYLNDAENNQYDGVPRDRFPYIYNLPEVYKQDFIDFQTKVVNKYYDSPRRREFLDVIEGTFSFIRFGHYKVDFQYVFPDGTTGSHAVFEYYNFLK